MGAGKGGDGEEAAQPVVLKLDLHCAGCAHKVKKAIRRVPGVGSIVTDVAANRVVVAGTADAGALKARLEAKTNKPVEVVSVGGVPPKPPSAEPQQDAGAAEKKGDKGANPKEEAKEQQAAEEEKKKPKEETVLLKIRLHCDGCGDRIRRRIYKFKGVKDVVLEGNAKDEVKVTGTMDVPDMLSYLKEKLNRDVEAVAPANKDGDGKYEDKKDGGGGGGGEDKNKGAAEAGGDDDKKDKGKGADDVPVAPSTAAAAALMAAPAGASTYRVAPPYPYGYVAAYQQQPPPPAGYYPYPSYYGNGDGVGLANPAHHYQQSQLAYPPYPYRFDVAPPPPPQLFSDENPNACSVM
uniref:Metal ion binding protein n=1 Tax=Zea mays TaxID=4577 RepID=B6U064_MAIZE|nr:metal ion binding protein [Zea mays]